MVDYVVRYRVETGKAVADLKALEASLVGVEQRALGSRNAVASIAATTTATQRSTNATNTATAATQRNTRAKRESIGAAERKMAAEIRAAATLERARASETRAAAATTSAAAAKTRAAAATTRAEAAQVSATAAMGRANLQTERNAVSQQRLATATLRAGNAHARATSPILRHASALRTLRSTIPTLPILGATTNLRQMGRAANESRRQIVGLQAAMRAFLVVFATFAIGGRVVRGFFSYVDALDDLQNRLKLVTESTRELNGTTSELFAISDRTRTAFDATGTIYSRTALAAKDLGFEQERLLRFTESLNQAVILSGVNAQEARAGLIQLSQGIASDTLRGDELRSVLENLPFVADVIADSLGVTRGELRALAKEGELTAETIVTAFEKAEDRLRNLFQTTEATFSQRLVVFENAVTRFINALDERFNISGATGRFLEGLTRALNSFADSFEDTNIEESLNRFDTFNRYLRNVGLEPVPDVIERDGRLVRPTISENQLQDARRAHSYINPRLLNPFGNRQDYFDYARGELQILRGIIRGVAPYSTSYRPGAAGNITINTPRYAPGFNGRTTSPIGNALAPNQSFFSGNQVLGTSNPFGITRRDGSEEPYNEVVFDALAYLRRREFSQPTIDRSNDVTRVRDNLELALQENEDLAQALDNPEVRDGISQVRTRIANQAAIELLGSIGLGENDLGSVPEFDRARQNLQETLYGDLISGGNRLLLSQARIGLVDREIQRARQSELLDPYRDRSAQRELAGRETGVEDALADSEDLADEFRDFVKEGIISPLTEGFKEFITGTEANITESLRKIGEAILEYIGERAFASAIGSATDALISDEVASAVGGVFGFNQGGSFIVGGRAGVDRVPVGFLATRGERVTVETQAQQRANDRPSQPIVINPRVSITADEFIPHVLESPEVQGLIDERIANQQPRSR